MLLVDDQLAQALRSNQTGALRGVATYQGNEVDVRLAASGQLVFNGDGEIQASAPTARAFGVGDSLVPHSLTDPLAPFGQELALWRSVKVRGAEWQIPLGVYRIVSSVNPYERIRRGVVLDWSIDLELTDRFEQIRADDFLAVDAPVPGNTVWAEIRRLSPIPVQQALGDAAVPPSTVYESRLGAIVTLLSLLGGVPHLTREGVLTARADDVWLTATDPVFDIEGTITWQEELRNDFYNQVQATNPNDASIVAYATINDDSNPLSVNRAGGRTYRHSSVSYSNLAAARAGALTVLSRVSSRRSRIVTVTCTPEALLLDLGDFGWMRDPVAKRDVLGEVSAIRVPFDPTASIGVDLIVAVEA